MFARGTPSLLVCAMVEGACKIIGSINTLPTLASPFGAFVVRILVLLFPFYFAWYQVLPLLRLLWPDTLATVKGGGGKIIVVARTVATSGEFDGGLKGIVLNPYTYTYGMPLFFALAVASTASGWKHFFRMSVGFAVLLVGLYLSVVASLMYMFQFDGEFARLKLLETPTANDALVEFIHASGFRVLPRALPVLLWAVLYREWAVEMIRSLRRRELDNTDEAVPGSG
jgi:hypothetical protein